MQTITEIMLELRKSFYRFKRAFESNDLKVNLAVTEVMMSNEWADHPSSNIDLCDISG